MRARPTKVGLSVLGVAGWLAGCTLVDQNTFHPGAGAAPVIPPAPVKVVAPVTPGPQPFLVIAPNAKPADYAAVVRKAVDSARARKPDVVFDVVEMEKPDAAADTVLGEAAVQVAEAIVRQGVPPARVRLDARPDGTAIPREVRVFVH